MKAAVLYGPRDLRVESTREPRLEPGEAIVRVASAGLCGTDYSIFTGDRPVDYPRVMGHELVGRVDAVAADVTTVRPGARVVVEPNYGCGRCPLCLEGNRNLCLSRRAIGIDVDGGFAELMRLPARCCWPAPDGAETDALLPWSFARSIAARPGAASRRRSSGPEAWDCWRSRCSERAAPACSW